MRNPSKSGARDSLGRFRRLTALTAAVTFALIVIGGVVRVSESGLGCGPAGSGMHGWPLCNGNVISFAGGSTLIEFSHRIVAGIVAVLIAVLVWRAWRSFRDERWLVRGSIGAMALVLVQAILGGLTVEYNLDAVLVAVHLGVAMGLLAILLGMYRAAGGFASRPGTPVAGTALKAATGAALVLVLATIVAGGYVAGTEGEGQADKPVAGAHTACGTDFPACGDAVLPFGRDPMIDAQLTHRLLMFVATIAVLAMAGLALRQRLHRGTAALAAALMLLQVLLGALNIWLGKHAGLIVGHLTLGTLIWAVLVWAGLSFFVRTPAGSDPPPNPNAKAVTIPSSTAQTREAHVG